MTMGSDGFFDQEIAAKYDQEHPDAGDLADCVAVLRELANGGSILEFAIGTGRIAIPLAAQGLAVHGIEASQPMVNEPRRKPGGDTLPVVIGDMATTRVEGDFSLVALVFNTICNLTTQAEQVECFRNAAAHLEPGGLFVIECKLPPLQKLPFGETQLAFDASATHFGVDEYDVATQRFTSHHLWLRDGQAVHRSMPFRYVWPAELDLMAQLAGMPLVERWGGWDKAAFDRHSDKHISIWQKPAG